MAPYRGPYPGMAAFGGNYQGGAPFRGNYQGGAPFRGNYQGTAPFRRNPPGAAPFRRRPFAPYQSESEHYCNVHLQEVITLKEVKEGNLSDRITTAIESVYKGVAAQSNDEEQQISVRISVKLLPKNKVKLLPKDEKPELPKTIEVTTKSLEDALQLHLEKKAMLMAELPKKLKQLQTKQSDTVDDNEDVSPQIEVKKHKRTNSESLGSSFEASPTVDDNEDVSPQIKVKKHKRTNSESLGSSFKASPGSKKQRRVSEGEMQANAATLNTSNLKMPKGKKGNANVTGEQTPQGTNIADNSVKSSKKNKRIKSVENVTPKVKSVGNVTPKMKSVGNVTPKVKSVGNVTPKMKSVGNVTPKMKSVGNVTPKMKSVGNVTPKRKSVGNVTPKRK